MIIILLTIIFTTDLVSVSLFTWLEVIMIIITIWSSFLWWSSLYWSKWQSSSPLTPSQYQYSPDCWSIFTNYLIIKTNDDNNSNYLMIIICSGRTRLHPPSSAHALSSFYRASPPSTSPPPSSPPSTSPTSTSPPLTCPPSSPSSCPPPLLPLQSLVSSFYFRKQVTGLLTTPATLSPWICCLSCNTPSQAAP